jgi:tetratricopeptide (TPR) repeat protein
LALILASQGKSDEAILLYKKAVKINPDLWGTQINLGNTLWRQGQLDEAIDRYREAIRSNPDYVRAYYGLSYVLSQKGQQAEANALKQKARDLEKKTQNVPNNPPY